MTRLCFLTILALLTLLSPLQVESKAKLRSIRQSQVLLLEDTPLYLPEERYVRLVTLGFNRFFSNVLWFQTVNYFGKQFTGSKDYRWLSQMCDLVIGLNPEAHHVIEFCGTLLAWEAKSPEESTRILTKAIALHPNEWRYLYLRGFNYWYFLEDPKAASEDFMNASQRPNAPAFLAGIASRLLISGNNAQSAVDFLRIAIERTNDTNARIALHEKLQRAILGRDLELLRNGLRIYEMKHGKKAKALIDLINGKVLTRLPSEPFGGEYVYDEEQGTVESTSGEKPLSIVENKHSTSKLK